jgi:hypothetical protein
MSREGESNAFISPASSSTPVATNGTKRAAEGYAKETLVGNPTPFSGVIRGNRSRAASTASSSSSRAGELAANLKARLGYAMTKVQNGWEHKSFLEVERLTAQKAAAALPTVPLVSQCTSLTTFPIWTLLLINLQNVRPDHTQHSRPQKLHTPLQQHHVCNQLPRSDQRTAIAATHMHSNSSEQDTAMACLLLALPLHSSLVVHIPFAQTHKPRKPSAKRYKHCSS